MPGAAPSAASEAMLMMWPLRRLTIRTAASLVPRMTPNRLMAIVRWVTSSDSSRNRPAGQIPALLTRTSIESEFPFDVVEECRERLTVGDVQSRVEPEIEVGA